MTVSAEHDEIFLTPVEEGSRLIGYDRLHLQ
jgi:hypothetical protein